MPYARTLLLLALAGVLAGLPARAQAPADAQAAAARLRALYFQHDFSAGAAEGRELARRFPQAPDVAAWYLGSLAETGYTDDAVAAADALLRAHPTGPWGHFARALAFAATLERRQDALAAARRARGSAPGNVDAWWLYASALDRIRDHTRAAAVADSALGRLGVSAALLQVKGRALAAGAASRGAIDSAQLARAATALDASLRLDSLNAEAVLERASVFDRSGERGRAYDLLKRAIALMPGALDVHQQYWDEVEHRVDRSEEQKREEVLADLEGLLSGRPDDPETLRLVASAYDDLKLTAERDSLEARLLRRFPGSGAAERLLISRIARVGNASFQEVVDTAVANAEKRRLLREFIARPTHRSREVLAGAYRSLLFRIEKDTTVSEDELVRVIHGLAAEPTNYYTAFVWAPVVLADRKLALPYAEQLASRALEASEAWLATQVPLYSPDIFARMRGEEIASDHVALGWVYFAEGKYTAASRELRAALEVNPASSDALYRLGRIEEAGGRITAAEKLYARGYIAERRGRAHPNEEALKRVYVARRGSPDGFERYVAQLEAQDRAGRRAAALAARVKSPRAMPAFRLPRLGGGTVSSDSLAGKVVVVDFWGVWCGPCVAEMPALQRLYNTYRDTADVAFVTIDANEPETVVREFMAKRKFDIPVLLDDGYVARAGVNQFPTTWFVGRDGRIAYMPDDIPGEALVEEFSWRIESLRAPAPALKAAPKP